MFCLSFFSFSATILANDTLIIENKQSNKQIKLSPEMQQSLMTQAQSQSDGLTGTERFVKYLKSGFVHIIPKGIDHILFVLGLFLATLTLKSLIWQVSTFTIAHSISLGLAVTGAITLSSDIVEPLIALSIAYIAFENIRSEHVERSRLLLIFVFGLLHGLGFAFVLTEFGLPQSNFLMSLLAFNIGVEAGQLVVILVAFILLFKWHNKPSYRFFVQMPLSILIGIVGLYWTIERIL